MPGGYLPPVTAQLVADASDMMATIEEVKAALEDLSKTPTEVTITANIMEAVAKIGELRADAQSLGGITIPISISDPQALAELVGIRSLLQGIAAVDPVSIPATMNMGPAVAEFAAGAAAMEATAAAAGGGSGLLGILGWGGGAFGFASFGSILALAGFGFEHFMATVLGLAGSLAGALVGGLTLAAGAFAVMGVGMLTDMAGMGQAAGDIKNVVQAQNALTQAIAVYGPKSTEAATAQAQVNYQLSSFSPIARAAVLQAANTAQGFHQMFNQVTGQAESTGAQILNTLMLLGEKFLPIIGKYAAENMAIIQKALMPLEAWLAGPGLKIFTQLEQLFQNNLPYAMKAFTNGVELVIKILGYAAQQTGGFTKWLAAFFAKWNSASAWPAVEKGLNTVIAMFHTWWALIKQVGVTIFDVFSKTLGLGTTIVSTVTQMLVKLDAWIQSTSGSKSLNTIFAAHLAEIKQILAVLPMLLSDFGQLYLLIAPDLTDIVTGLVKVVGWMLKIPGAGVILGWGLAIAVLIHTMGLLTFAKWIKNVAMLAFSFTTLGGGEGIAAAASAGLAAAMDLIPIFALITGIALLVTGIVLLVTHWNAVVAFMGKVFSAFNGLPAPIKILLAVLFPFITIPALIIANWQKIVTFFHNLPGWIVNELGQLPGQILTFFSRIPGTIVTALTKGLPAILGFFLGLGGKILGALASLAGTLLTAAGKAIAGFVSGLVKALPTVLKFFIEFPFVILGVMGYIGVFLIVQAAKAIAGFVSGLWKALPSILAFFIALPGNILKLFATVATWLWNVAMSLIGGLLGGIKKAAPTVWNWFTALPGTILGLLTRLPGLLLAIGGFLITGLWNGMTATWTTVTTWFHNLPGAILGFFAGAATWLFNIGKSILNGLWNGLKSVWSSLTGWIGGIGNWITSHKGPISVDAVLLYPHGMAIMQGLHNGLKAGIPPILSTLTNLSVQMGNAVTGNGKLALSGSANATVLHSLANSRPTPPGMIGNAGAAGGGGSQTLTVQMGDINVTVPNGTPASVGHQIGGQAQAAVNKALNEAVRQLGAGSKQYGFLPG
jgi:hypothetical protein